MNLLQGIEAAVLLSFATERIVEYLLGWPLEKLAPDVDRGWLRYAILVVGGVASWFSEWTIFTPEMGLNTLVARIATAVIVGAGPQVIHAIVNEALKE